MAFGPVQDFIAQARTTSDLWAGSHLLSRIAWEGMRVVCEKLGPQSILFPQLRRVPQVDLWLLEQGLNPELFDDVSWKKSGSDANPLFAAALPNKFLALVPESMADELAQTVKQAVADWVLAQGQATIDALFDKTEMAETVDSEDGQDIVVAQLQQQLAGFPEVHWTAVPWQNEEQGRETLAAFYPDGCKDPGFFGSEAWKMLPKEKMELVDGMTLFKPNEGTLYPVNYDLAERSLAAAKTVRTFPQLQQHGYRCSLCGEREWLTHDRELLSHYPNKGDKLKNSLWSIVGKKQPSWARKGEHLCGLCAIKRIWPSRFAEEVGQATGREAHRFVVSTHTMALVSSLDRWRQQNARNVLPIAWQSQLDGVETVALPAGLISKLRGEDEAVSKVVRKLPALLQHYQDRDDLEEYKDRGDSSEQLGRAVRELFGHKPESYYALILMDGDSMGAWLSDGDSKGINYGDAFHSKVQAGLDNRKGNNQRLRDYLQTPKAVSPARHIAISSALNSFALEIVPYVVESMFKGKLLYAGGDDVLAMVSVDDLLPCLTLLRYAYSGIEPSKEVWRWVNSTGVQGEKNEKIKIANGHIYLKSKLYRMMGRDASASVGAIIAHHQAPLGKVLTELRAAESRAKNSGRDTFSLSILRRSGGRSDFSGKWQLNHPSDEVNFESSPMGLLLRSREALSDEKLSRRAAYILQEWLRQMPQQPNSEMLKKTMEFQFERQGGDAQLGRELAQHGERLCYEGVIKREDLKQYLSEQLGVAEFLAREGRG